MADNDTLNYKRAIDEVDALVQGAITSLTGKQPTLPDFISTDLAPFAAELEKTTTQREVTNLQIGTERDRLNDASFNKREAQKVKAAAEADKILADQAKAQAEANIYKQLATTMGVDPAQIAIIADQLTLERPKAEAMLREIQQMQAVSPTDNIIGWFVNQLELPSKIDPYNRQADIVNMLQDTLDRSVITANRASEFNAKSIPSITADQARQSAKVKIAEGAIENAKAEEELARTNVNFAVQKLSNDIAVANMTKEMTQLQVQQKQQEYQAAINAINIADNHANRMLKAAQLLEKLNKDKGIDVILENYDRIMGHPKGTTNRYTFERFGETQRVNIVAIGAGSGGTDPFQAILNVGNARPGPLFGSGKLYMQLQDWAENIAKLPEVQLIDEKQKPLVISKKLKEQIDREKLNPGRIGGLFYELSPAEMIAAGLVPADSEVAKILEPYVRTKEPIPTSMIVAAFDKLYTNPTIAGAALADYYRRNIELRNRSMNYSLFAIKPDDKYVIPVRYGDESVSFGGVFKLDVDLTSSEQATKYILIRRAGEQAAKMAYPYHGAQ